MRNVVNKMQNVLGADVALGKPRYPQESVNNLCDSD